MALANDKESKASEQTEIWVRKNYPLLQKESLATGIQANSYQASQLRDL